MYYPYLKVFVDYAWKTKMNINESSKKILVSVMNEMNDM